jgi:acyl dehydratase
MHEPSTSSLVDRIRPLLGKPSEPRRAPDPVNAPMIRHWCQALSDLNPVYVDPVRAARSVHGGIVAPPTMLDAWLLDPNPPGVIGEILRRLDAAGYTSVVATNSEHEYDRYLRPSDDLTATTSLTDISDEKQTALGVGHFFTNLTELHDGNGEPVGRVRMRILKFKPGTARAPQGLKGDQSDTRPARSEESARHDMRFPGRIPRQTTLCFDDVSVGEELPPLSIPITCTLIVAGAIASRDFTPVHHDVELARAQGSADIFMNILTTNGLCSRYVTDWTGPDAILRKLSVRLGAPNYPGDTMTFSGSVAAKNAGGLVDIALCGRNGLGNHVTGTITIELPPTPNP